MAVCLATLGAAPAASQDAAPPPSAFFPLQPGNTFDYESDAGGSLRRTVLHDTLVGGRAYVVVADTVWDRGGRPARTARYVARYDADSARVAVWDGAGERTSPDLAPCPLTAEAVVACATGGAAARRHVTEGTVSLAVAPDLAVATRTYASEEGFGVLVLAEGIGPVLVADLRQVYTLRYARVGERELGEPVRAVVARSVPAPPGPAAPLEPRLRVWPNPAVGPVTLRYEGADDGPATAEVFDALGRRVLTAPLPPTGDVRQVVLDLSGAVSPGAYTVRVRGGAGGVVARFVKL